MQDNNYSKRRYYLNKKGQNSPYTSPINTDYNKYQNIKLSEKGNYNRRYEGIISNYSNESKNLNLKSNQEKKDIVKENISFYHRKNNNYLQYSTDNSNITNNDNNNRLNTYNSPSRKNYLNKTNIKDNSNNRYNNYLNKKPDYKTVNQKTNYESKDFYDNKFNNNSNYYNEPSNKTKNKKTIINNYDYNKIFTNQTYDFNIEHLKNKNNYEDKKRHPIIIIEKNKRYRFSRHNGYDDKHKIIKIQSAWRGYFLRKITVGGIKKYIGFIALFKYLEKIVNAYKRSLFDDLINILKKKSNAENLKYKYRKLVKNEDKYNKEQNNNNEKSNNNNRRFRNFNLLRNNKKDNNTEKVLFQNNYIFNDDESDSVVGSYNTEKRNNNKTGVSIYFINKEKEKEREREKEQRKKEQIEREKENEKRRLEREQRKKEQIERENEIKRLEKLRKEKELKEKREKERLERIRLEKEKEEKEKERREKERREKERREKERREKERREKERKEKERREKERIEKERKEKERKDKERKEKERKEKEKIKNEEKEKLSDINNNEDDIFVKFIYKKCYKENYPILLYQLKIILKLNITKIKIDSLYNIIKMIQKKQLKKWLKIYRENVLNEKVKEEIMKKNIFKSVKEKNNEKLENIKYTKTPNKFIENEINDIIIEDKNENEEEINSTIEEKIILRGKRKHLLKQSNKDIILRNILNKKIALENKNKFNILNNYFKKWNKTTNKYYEKAKSNIKINLHSPDMEIRQKSKKKHIKIKYSRAITSKTSIGSIKSEGKSNSSTIHTKKMRIKNVVVGQTEYLTTTLLNNSQMNMNNINKNKKIIKLLFLIDKIDNKNLMYKCFKYWKKDFK